MEEANITALVRELAEYAQVLDASDVDRDAALLGSVAHHLREQVSSLYEILDDGPKPWRNASGGAWVAVQSAGHLEELLAQSELDWDRIGAAVSFAVSGVEIIVAKWNQVVEPTT